MKKKVTEKPIPPKTNKKKWLLYGAIGLFVLGALALVVILLSAKFYQINKTNSLFQEQQTSLTSELKRLESIVLSECEENNALKQYLLYEKVDCKFILEDHTEETSHEINLENDFLTFFDVFLSQLPEYEGIKEKIIEKNSFDTKSKTEETKSNEDNLKIQEQFKNIYNNENIQSYLEHYALTINKTNESEFQITKVENNEVVAKIILNDTYNCIGEIVSIEKKIVIENISHSYREIQSELQNTSNEQIQSLMTELKNLSDDQLPRENIMILGRQGGNVDTIILASVDHTNEKITLISVPRDLWVDGRKINSYFAKFGMKYFIATLEKTLKQKISYYALIDIVAFPEMVNMLGGIDYTFTTPLIDPSYKTIDDGVEGTLYFDTGTHHLNGIQALRVARTRKTSSDFARAERQQKILAILKEKASSSLSPDKILNLSKIVLKNLDTNITPSKALQLYSQSKNYTVRTGNVMSTGNIFNSTYHELENGTKAYIIEPRDGNWDLIPQYIWNALQK